jgi:mono/diheme cytochrome c family protein
MRGQTEYKLIAAINDLGEGEALTKDYATLVEGILTPIANLWSEANKAVIQPAEKPAWDLKESIAAGRELFYGAKANCVKCHGPSELGDGQTSDYDDWTKPLVEYAKEVDSLPAIRSDKDLSAEEKSQRIAQLDALHTALEDTTLPTRHIIPRNLRTGIYRGGGRPLDLFRRIHAGINGVPMPGTGPPSPGAPGVLSPDEIWHLVDYLQQLPYEPISQPLKATPFSGQAQL